MTCSPGLLKNLGIKLAMELTKYKEVAEQRMFQAILVQAFEDALNQSAFKKETYWKQDSHLWFIGNSKDFQDVCWGAEMDPDFIRQEYIKLIREKKIFFTQTQVSWLRYRDLYKRYRAAGDKESRRKIRELIISENLDKLS